MSQSIRVRILNREFSLIVKQGDERLTRQLADYVDTRVKDFRRSHPEQPELTAAIITALAIAEELFIERDQHDQFRSLVNEELGSLAHLLDDAVEPARILP